MRKILQRNEKVELNSFIDEFVKARQKYFTPGQEWLEAELAEEKISVYMDKAQLEKDLDELVKTSLMYGKVRNLEMKIQVKKTADGAGICFSDNGVGNWRNKSICVTGKPGRGLVLASGEISHLLSGENDQSQSDRNNQCISFSFL